MSDHAIGLRISGARIVFVAALWCCTAVAVADTPPASTTQATPTALLQDFVSDAHVKHSLEAVASHSTVMVQSKCDDAQYTVDDKFEIVRPPTFDSSGNPISGAWKQAVSETGCKDAHVLNIFVQVKEGGGLAAEPLLPGATHLDPVAQKEGIDKAVGVASEVPGSGDSKCHTGYVADTKFLEDSSAPSKGATGPEWKETWTLISCRRKFLVPMAFELSDKGVHIFAGPVAHVKLIPLGGASEFVGGGEFMGRTTSGH
jgi:hypothetical protein